MALNWKYNLLYTIFILFIRLINYGMKLKTNYYCCESIIDNKEYILLRCFLFWLTIYLLLQVDIKQSQELNNSRKRYCFIRNCFMVLPKLAKLSWNCGVYMGASRIHNMYVYGIYNVFVHIILVVFITCMSAWVFVCTHTYIRNTHR